MSKIRAVFFDFGGVLYKIPNRASTQRWLRLFGTHDHGALEMLSSSVRESELVMNIMTGKLLEQHAWDHLAQTIGLHPAIFALFRKSSYSARRLDKAMAQYFANLRPRFRTAILTNAGTDFRGTFLRIYGLEKLADQVIISAEVGLAKPDPAIYHLAAERMQVSPDECVFVDDMLENVEAAREVGMQTFHHTSTPQTLQQLNQLLSQ